MAENQLYEMKEHVLFCTKVGNTINSHHVVLSHTLCDITFDFDNYDTRFDKWKNILEQK